MPYANWRVITDPRWRMARYLFSGGLNTIFGLMLIGLFMYGFGLALELSNFMAYGIGVVTSFILNKTFTFRSNGRVMIELSRFISVYAASYLTNLVVLVILVRLLGTQEFLAQIIASAAFVVTSYVLQARYVFSRS